MTTLKLFGMDLGIARGKVAQPTGEFINVLNWNANLSKTGRDTYDLALDAHIIWKRASTLSAQLTLRYRLDGNRFLLVSEQPTQNTNSRFGFWCRVLNTIPSGGVLQLESGIVRIRLNDMSNRLHTYQDDLSVAYTNASSFAVGSARWPLSAKFGSGGISIDLGAGKLFANPGMFSCQTYALRSFRAGSHIKRQLFFRRGHESVRQSFDLGVGFANPILSFVPGQQDLKDVAFLPLQTDLLSRKACGAYSETNPVVTPLGLADYTLNLSLTEGDSKPVLNRVFATPRKSTGAIVKTFAVGQRKTNAPSVFNFDGELELVMRLDSLRSPSTLMVAPVYGHGGRNDRGLFAIERAGDEAIHGIVPDAVFTSDSACHLECTAGTIGATIDPNVDGIEQCLVYDVTLPTLVADARPAISYPRPGQVYAECRIDSSGGGGIDNWQFQPRGSSAKLVLPLMQLSMVEAAGLQPGEIGRQYLCDVNRRTVSEFAHIINTVQHETFMLEEPADDGSAGEIRLSELYIVDNRVDAFDKKAAPDLAPALESFTFRDNPAAKRNSLKVKEHPIVRDYGPIKVIHRVLNDAPSDYFVLRKLDDVDKFGSYPEVKDSASILIPGIEQLKIGSFPKKESDPGVNRPLGILKLSSNLTLAEIFRRERITTDIPDLTGKNFLTDIVAQPIRAKGWTGLLLFNMDLNIDKFPILQTIIGKDALKIRYLAITAEKSVGKTADRAFSYSGRIRWSNPSPPEAPKRPGNTYEEQRTFESTFTAREVDIAWVDNQLTRFCVESDVEFHSVAGIGNQERSRGKRIELKIIGSYDKKEDKFRFLSKLAKKIPIITTQNKFGPIKQIYLKRAEIVRSRLRTVIELDGEVDCRPIEFNGRNWIDYPTDDTRRILFRGLGLEFPTGEFGGKKPQWLKFNYPSLKLDPNLPQFNLFGLEWLQLKVQNIGLDIGNRFDWSGLSQVYGVRDFKNGALITDIRLRFGKLPDLIAKKIKELTFDFSVGVGFTGGEWPHIDKNQLLIAIKAVGFKQLNLDLMRFLVLEADTLTFGMKDFGSKKVSKLKLINLRIKILEKKVIDGLTLHMYGTPEPDGKMAILAFYGPNDGATVNTGLLDIYWILVGRNLMLSNRLVKDILSIDSKTTVDDQKGVAKILNGAVKDDSILPISQSDGHTNVGEWLFGAGFGFFDGLVIGKFLYQDKAYCGIALRGAFLEEWFGYELAISIVYFKRARPGEDSFFVQVRVPAVEFTTFQFTGGVIAIEVFVNGGFVLDVGFPWIDQFGSRRWDRTFGAFILPYQGSGGFYLGYRKTTVIIDPANEWENIKLVQAVGGYAIQGGFGASFNNGQFRVWVRAGFYFIVEGELILHNRNIHGLRLVGAVGILVEGAGELNWWIISVRIGVLASAEARATLIWGMDTEKPQLVGPSSSDVILYLDFVLHARASAHACIGSGPFKICKGISASVSMPFRQQIKLK